MAILTLCTFDYFIHLSWYMWPECRDLVCFVGLVQFDIHFCLHTVPSECTLNAEIYVKYLILLVSILILHVWYLFHSILYGVVMVLWCFALIKMIISMLKTWVCKGFLKYTFAYKSGSRLNDHGKMWVPEWDQLRTPGLYDMSMAYHRYCDSCHKVSMEAQKIHN